jgi:hypothetical protein
MSDRARAEAQQKARDYLRTRATLLPPDQIRERIADAYGSLASVLAEVPIDLAGRRPGEGEWSIQEIVDHLVETYRPGVDELRCLLAGERPPDPPIPASLRSKAPRLRPWPWLVDELAHVHEDVMKTLETVTPGFETAARAPLVMVVNVKTDGGGLEPFDWIEDLDWKAYAVVSWRLHAIDHLRQAQRVLAALR